MLSMYKCQDVESMNKYLLTVLIAHQTTAQARPHAAENIQSRHGDLNFSLNIVPKRTDPHWNKSVSTHTSIVSSKLYLTPASVGQTSPKKQSMNHKAGKTRCSISMWLTAECPKLSSTPLRIACTWFSNSFKPPENPH